MKKRLISMAMALLLVAGLPVSAFAQDYDLSEGSIEVTATASTSGEGETATTTTSYSVSQAKSTGTETSTPDSVTIYQKEGAAATQNTVTITANDGATANVTLKDVNIDVSNTGSYKDNNGKAAVSTSGTGNVTIELDGDNTVESGYGHAGLEKNNNGDLIIDSKEDGSSLTAMGGDSGAGIGSARNVAEVSGITINSGKVTATGGDYAAGIGSGYYKNNTTKVSEIKINGGTVNATGGRNGAGIGGGFDGSVEGVSIKNATVEAKGGTCGAGIGGGYEGSTSNINISDSEVTAEGGEQAAGIGGGYEGSTSNINISGGTVTAKGGNGGAGIGCGVYADGCESITVSGDAQVKVQGGNKYDSTYSPAECGAAIGNGGTSEGTGKEVEPDVSMLTTKGKIEYYAPGADMSTADPTSTTEGKYVPSDDKKPDGKTESKTASPAASPAVKLYSVVDKDGKSISYKTEVKDGVLTVTVDGDYAVLTGTAANISALTAQGITTVVFVTSGATSTFDLADLSAKGSGTYKLTHDGAAVTFTLDATNISEILK